MDRFEMVTMLQIVLLVLGTKELFAARAYYRQQKKKWAIASFCMGVFGCACAILSMTGVV
jgi:hypothetical protein